MMTRMKDGESWYALLSVDGIDVGGCGFSYYDDEGRGVLGIGDFSVYPELRRKGYGRKAIKRIIREYGESGLCDMVCCHVDARNEAAMAFWGKVAKKLLRITDKQAYAIIWEKGD